MFNSHLVILFLFLKIRSIDTTSTFKFLYLLSVFLFNVLKNSSCNLEKVSFKNLIFFFNLAEKKNKNYWKC